MNTATYEDIAQRCRVYADALDDLDELLESIEDDCRRLVRQKMRSVRARTARVADAEHNLMAAVESAPELFEKPRTRTFEGIKVGLRKQPGKVEIADEARAIALIRKQLPDSEEVLIRVRETVDKTAARKLPVNDLAKIGGMLTEDQDEVTISRPPSPVRRVADVLIADFDEGAE